MLELAHIDTEEKEDFSAGQCAPIFEDAVQRGYLGTQEMTRELKLGSTTLSYQGTSSGGRREKNVAKRYGANPRLSRCVKRRTAEGRVVARYIANNGSYPPT